MRSKTFEENVVVANFMDLAESIEWLLEDCNEKGFIHNLNQDLLYKLICVKEQIFNRRIFDK